MHKLLLSLLVSSAVAFGGCTVAHSMGGGVPLTADEIQRHNAIMKKISTQPRAPKVVGAQAKKPVVVLHRAVVPQPKPAPLAKAPDPVKAKPTILERFIALKRRWF